MSVDVPRWAAARNLAYSAPGLQPARGIALHDAVGRVLAEPLVAAYGLPRDATSAMDGWAVAARNTDGWRIVGQVLAGSAPRHALNTGEAVEIATGAVVPQGARAIVRSEDGEAHDGTLHAEEPDSGRHIRPAGEECAAGEQILHAGTRLQPAQVGLCAALGLDTISVRSRVLTAGLVFGDEVLQWGQPAVGQVRDSIGPQLPGWVAGVGGEIGPVRYVSDTLADHSAAIERALGDARVVITSGGTAAGPKDHLHRAIAALNGSLLVDSVAVRPGHPMLLAQFGDRYLLGLPGNPQSAVVALLTLGEPLFRGLLGQQLPEPSHAVAATAIPAPAAEDRLVAGNLAEGRFTPASKLGSAMLRGLAESRGFAVVPPGGAQPGEVVGWLELGYR